MRRGAQNSWALGHQINQRHVSHQMEWHTKVSAFVIGNSDEVQRANTTETHTYICICELWTLSLSICCWDNLLNPHLRGASQFHSFTQDQSQSCGSHRGPKSPSPISRPWNYPESHTSSSPLRVAPSSGVGFKKQASLFASCVPDGYLWMQRVLVNSVSEYQWIKWKKFIQKCKTLC